MRWWPPHRPLLERFGGDFFRRVPRGPGVYLMGGVGDRLLYVGQSGNLRARLNSYKNLHPDRSSRRLVRLVAEVRTITWELVSSADEAQLRENELLRRHKPKFNVMNTRPEHYRFVRVRESAQGVWLGSSPDPRPGAGEQVYGAFKGAGRVRGVLGGLRRLVWAGTHPVTDVHIMPLGLAYDPGLDETVLPSCGTDQWALGDWLRRYLAGESDGLVTELASRLPDRTAAGHFLAGWWEQDLELLRQFYLSGPDRNRHLRRSLDVADSWIGQAELDDLLVLERRLRFS